MLDQHYMIDEQLLQRIVKEAKVSKKDIILEIGGGTGNLTELLAAKAKQVVVIEKDPKHRQPLQEKLADAKNVTLMFDDAISVHFPEFNKCISNLPYTICEPLLWKLTRYEFDLLVFVVPKRFADKLLGKQKSRLTLLADAFYDVKYVEDIFPNSFEPRPKVLSSLITITKKEESNFILTELLSQYDKKTKNALREMLMRSGLTKTQAKEQIAVKIRPALQTKKIASLSLQEILDIIKAFTEK